MSCIFCEFQKSDKVVFENELAYAIMDGFPVNVGHMLIIPKRHVETYFDVSKEEATAMYELALQAKEYLTEKYHPDGFNIGLNCGEYAGQTVMHCHMHIIPRYKGDVEKPRGGVRNIIKSISEY